MAETSVTTRSAPGATSGIETIATDRWAGRAIGASRILMGLLWLQNAGWKHPPFTTNSGVGGTFTATYPIPAQLAGTPQIAIRLQSASGYYSYNWFFNATAP